MRLVERCLPSHLGVVACLVALCGQARADDSLWQTDFAAAKTKAKAEKKLLLVDFTGSDWCVFCKRLKSEIFDQEAFKKEAPKSFVLVELDFPQGKELPKELKEQNEKLLELYKVRGFPTILLIDANGEAIAQTGYRPGSPEDYLKNLKELVALHESVVAMKAKVASVSGLDRAKLLDEIISAIDKLNVSDDSAAKYGDEIIALDADNKAGLKTKYTFRKALAEAAELKENRKLAEAQAVLEKAVALPGLTGDQKQDVYIDMGECCFMQQDFIGVAAQLNKALKAAPESEKATQVKRMLERFGPMADAQATVAKLLPELEKVKGLDRARVLDQLVDAQAKLGMRSKMAEIEKWMKEIIELDPDNKAGLKTKYELRELMKSAMMHLRARDAEKLQEVVAKARKLPGLTDDQKKMIDSLAQQQEKLPPKKDALPPAKK